MMSASMLLFDGSALPQSRSTVAGHSPSGVGGRVVEIGWAGEVLAGAGMISQRERVRRRKIAH